MKENWIDKVFKENYQFVRALKNTKEKVSVFIAINS